MARTNVVNIFRTTLTSSVGPTDLTFPVETLDGAPSSPALLVLGPRDDSNREVALFDGTFSSSNFVTTDLANRYLAGSAQTSGITHEAGTEVVCVPLAQHIDDLWDALETIETGLADHLADALAAHAASAVSFDPTGLTNIAGTDVQTAFEEVDAALESGSSDTLFVDASRFEIIAAAPTRSQIGRWIVWLLDAAAVEEAVGTIIGPGDIPPGWSTYTTELLWANATADAGDVVFQRIVTNAGAGDTLASGTSSTAIPTAGSQNVLTATSIGVAETVPTAAQVTRIEVRRLGANVSDTKADDVALLGIRLTKAS